MLIKCQNEAKSQICNIVFIYNKGGGGQWKIWDICVQFQRKYNMFCYFLCFSFFLSLFAMEKDQKTYFNAKKRILPANSMRSTHLLVEIHNTWLLPFRHRRYEAVAIISLKREKICQVLPLLIM